MLSVIRHSIHNLRAWLLAAAAILLLTSVLETGHKHGIFVAVDDGCVLCHQIISFDKVLVSQPIPIVFLLIVVLALAATNSTNPLILTRFICIRAPPTSLYTR